MRFASCSFQRSAWSYSKCHQTSYGGCSLTRPSLPLWRSNSAIMCRCDKVIFFVRLSTFTFLWCIVSKREDSRELQSASLENSVFLWLRIMNVQPQGNTFQSLYEGGTGGKTPERDRHKIRCLLLGTVRIRKELSNLEEEK